MKKKHAPSHDLLKGQGALSWGSDTHLGHHSFGPRRDDGYVMEIVATKKHRERVQKHLRLTNGKARLRFGLTSCADYRACCFERARKCHPHTPSHNGIHRPLMFGSIIRECDVELPCPQNEAFGIASTARKQTRFSGNGTPPNARRCSDGCFLFWIPACFCLSNEDT